MPRTPLSVRGGGDDSCSLCLPFAFVFLRRPKSADTKAQGNHGCPYGPYRGEPVRGIGAPKVNGSRSRGLCKRKHYPIFRPAHVRGSPFGNVKSMTNRPAWTLTEAVQRTGISRSTLRRYLDAGRFPNAYKDTSKASRFSPGGSISGRSERF
jgi:predicted DNA-binding transcriptional regulator AlpA